MANPAKQDPLATPSASPLAAHLARFRYNSPTRSPTSPARNTRRSARAGVAAASSVAEVASLSPPATPPKPLARKRSTETTPRADGSSPYFKRRVEEGDSSLLERGLKGGEGDVEEEETPVKKKRKRPARPFADASVYAHLGEDPLTDYMVEDGRLMLCGINPGRLSAEKGLHYANPTNHYWRCLSGSGLTDRLLDPSEGPLLSERYGISATNLVPRPTAEMSEISNDEMKACVPSLLRKIIKYRPRVVAFVGMKICEIVLRYLHNLPRPNSSSTLTDGRTPSKKRRPAMPKVKIGLQPVTISLPSPPAAEDGEAAGEGAEEEEKERRKIYIWCLPSTSARVVEYQLVDKIAIFTRLKNDIDALLASPLNTLETPEGTVDHRAEDILPPQEEIKEEEREEKEEGGDKGGEVAGGGSGWTVTMISAADIAGEAAAPIKEEEA